VYSYGVWKIWKSGTGTGTGDGTLTGTLTGKINECFQYGSMIDFDPFPPFSAFARWMTRGALLRKGISTKNLVLTIIFS